MPLKPKYEKMRSEMIKKYGKEKGEKVFWAKMKKEGINPDAKSFIFYSDEFKSMDNGNIVEGYISTGDKDLVSDVVTPNCLVGMLKQLKDRVIKMDVEHESFRGNSDTDKELNKSIIPVGKITDASLDAKGIKVKTVLNPHNSRYQEVKNSIKDGFLDAFSIAYVPKKFAYKSSGDDKVRMLDNVSLLNVAYTGNPVNPNASFTSVALKSLDNGVEFDEDTSEYYDESNGGNNMKENEKEEVVNAEVKDEESKEAPKEDAPKEEPKADAPEETPAESSDEQPEQVEAKALYDKVDALTNNIAELKDKLDEKKSKDDAIAELKSKVDELDKVLSEPQFKARVNHIEEARKTLLEEKAKREQGPLDAIN